MTYTYDDIITAKDILAGRVKQEDIIGKEGWFLNCIPRDFSEKTLEYTGSLGELFDFDCDANFPFYDGELCWQYFLPKKETEKKYVPFDLSNEKDRAKLRGAWIREKDSPRKTEMQIIGFRITETDKEWCCDLGSWVPAEDLLSDWVFLDGSPVGKLANTQQITSK